MKETLIKLSERGKHIDTLYESSEQLSVQAKLWKRGANRTRKRMCLAELKLRACVLAGIAILIVSVTGAVLITAKAVAVSG